MTIAKVALAVLFHFMDLYLTSGISNNSQPTIVLPIENVLETFYYTTIGLGSPSRGYKVLLDTGSADLWISQERYHPLPTSAKNLHVNAETFYGLGSARGNLYTDVVTAGKFATQQAFLRASSFSNRMPAMVDGMLGLAFLPNSWVNHALPSRLKANRSFIEKIAGEHRISPCFGIFLGSAAVSGELVIGDCQGNPARYVGGTAALAWYAVGGTKRDWWHVPITGLSVDGTVVSRRGTRALVDTGTALIAVDYETAEKANAAFGAYPTNIRGVWGVSCDAITSSNTTVAIIVGEKHFKLTGKDLRVQHQVDNPGVCYAPFMVSEWAEKNKVWILGAVFLRRYYTVYDYYGDGSNPRLGFAATL